MEAIDPLPRAPHPIHRTAEVRLDLRVVELAAVSPGPGAWVPGPDDAATARAVERLRAVGYVLGDSPTGDALLDPFLVDAGLRLVYGGECLAALRKLGETHAQVLVAEGLPEDVSFRLLLAQLLRPVPATATPMQIHRAEQPIRALIAAAAKERQRRAGRLTAAARWGSGHLDEVASADSAEATQAAAPGRSAVAEVIERALEAVTSPGDARTKHRQLGLTSSVDEYEAIEKIIVAANDPAEAAEVRAVAAAQLAALDTDRPPAISTALRRVHEARHDARARSLVVAPPVGQPEAALVDAVVAALQHCVERLDDLLTPRSAAARSISQADAGERRLRAAADAAQEIPRLIAGVAEVL